MSEKLAKDFRDARRASIPLLCVSTPDPAETMRVLMGADLRPAPYLVWDFVTGVNALNDAGVAALNAAEIKPAATTNPVAALAKLANIEANTIVFYRNAHLFYGDPGVKQAIWNLRDQFKLDKRMLVMLAPMHSVPPEIEGDVVSLDEPLPTEEQARTLIEKQYANVKPAITPDPKTLTEAVRAVIGLPAFAIEQVTAMSMKKSGADVDALWNRKRAAIEATPGLGVWRGGESYDSVGGCANIKNFLNKVIAGRLPFNAVAFFDEIEKQVGGAEGARDGGTSSDQLQMLLTYMQDNRVPGLLFIGHPGVAKSAIAKATGNTAGVPTISVDLGGMKNSLVGSSEARIRAAFKTITSVSSGKPLFIATCNNIDALKPELRRRFKFGTFFFDLPDTAERDAIWRIYEKKYNVGTVAKQRRPRDEKWTGAEIENCCELAWALDTDVEDAANYIAPIAISAADRVKELQTQADGRFISASYPGFYKTGKTTAVGDGRSRAIEMEE